MKKTTIKTKRGRPKQPIKRYVSAEAIIRLESHIKEHPPLFNYEIETFWFILDLFYRLPLYNKNIKLKKGGFIPMSTTYFKFYISKNHSRYIKTLIDSDLIESDGDFSAAMNICLGYRLNPVYEGHLKAVELSPDTKIWKAITKKRNSTSHKAMAPHIKQMKTHFRKILFDHEGAMNYSKHQLNQGEISINQFNVREMSVMAMKNKGKSLFYNRNQTNFRVDSNLTNIKKELRNFIIGDFIQIDLANSQPYLFNYLLLILHSQSIHSYSCDTFNVNLLNPSVHKLLRGLINPPSLNLDEVMRYNEWTRNGSIYDLLKEKIGISRDEAKKLFLAAFYSSNYSQKYKEAKKVFASEFPSIYNLIYQLKIKNYKALPVAMQHLESDIFIDHIAQRLYDLGIDLYTVHDSIVIEKKHQETALKVMEDVFIMFFGEIPKFDVEELSPKNLKSFRLTPEVSPEQLNIPFVYDYNDELQQSA